MSRGNIDISLEFLNRTFQISSLNVLLLAPGKSACGLIIYYINISEIPSELSRENFISSHVKITCYLHT